MQRFYKRWEERKYARYLRELLGKSDPPAAPDYVGAAQAQGTANVDTAKIQGRINNPNVVTPYGTQSVSWDQKPDSRVFDQAGYDNSMQAYRNQLGTVGGNPYSFDANGNPLDNNGQRITGTAGGMPAPSMDSFWRTIPGGSGDTPTITQTLSPQEKVVFDAQERIKQNLAGTAEQQLGRVSSGMNSPFDTSGLSPQVSSIGHQNWATGVDGKPVQEGLDYSGAPAMPQANEAARKSVVDSLYGQATSRLDPRYAEAEDRTRTNLAASGHSMGDRGYSAAMDEFNRGKNDAYTSAMNTAISGGTDAMQKLYGMELQGRQQGVNEFNTQGAFANQAQQQEFAQGLQNATLQNSTGQQKVMEALQNANLSNASRQRAIEEQSYLRSLPLNELNSLRTGAQVQMPQFQPFQGSNIAPPPIYQGTQDASAYQTDMFNVKSGQQSQQNQMAAQAAIMGAMMWASDVRLKRNIKRIGEHPLGIGIYSYNYIWDDEPQVGVMAQEVLEVKPEAVIQGSHGYYAVNYGVL